MFQAGCSMRLPEICGLVFQVARNTGYLKKLERKHSISPAPLPAIPSMPRRLTRQEEMKCFRCI